jgi:prolyl oligopeptidase
MKTYRKIQPKTRYSHKVYLPSIAITLIRKIRESLPLKAVARSLKLKPLKFASIGLATCLLLISIVTPHTLAQNSPAIAPVREVKDTYFGQTVTDPYRWMEDLKAGETKKWMKTQADRARAYLDDLPMREEIFKEINDLSDTSVRVDNIRQRGNLYFYQRRAPGENDFKIYVREGLNGKERLLVDPEKRSSKGKRYSLGAWNTSWDGKYLSYIISVGGAENGEMRVVEVETGRDLGERIDRTRFGGGAWLPDGRSFLYPRQQKLTPGAPATDFYQKGRIYLHQLGRDPDTDKAVFGFDVNPNIKFDEKLATYISTNPAWKYALARVNAGVSPNSEYYVAPLDTLDRTPIPWRKIVSFDDEVSSVSLRGEDLYLRTYKDTPRYKIVRTSLLKPDLKQAETIFPASEAVVEDFNVQKDALYVQTLDGGNRKIWRVDYQNKEAEAIALPYEGSASLGATPADRSGIFFDLVSWTKSNAFFVYDPINRTAKDTKLVPPIAIDLSGIEFINAKAKSDDGTQIPLVIIYKRGLKRDGTNPVRMHGYGAYRSENTSPVFITSGLTWLDRGGVIVLTGVRGGGEYGHEWHRAGFQKTKPNTWKDFIACAKYLIREKYTSPQHLGIEGGSAGGILISNAIAERPELFGAAIINVGLNNVLRNETTANGVPNIPEFGSFKTEEGFRSLLAMDGYHKIKDGLKYPATLLTHGINDPRVEPWMSAKMAARLQAASKNGKPVLLRIDYDAGHGQGSTKQQRNAERADTYAFLLQQLK